MTVIHLIGNQKKALGFVTKLILIDDMLLTTTAVLRMSTEPLLFQGSTPGPLAIANHFYQKLIFTIT